MVDLLILGLNARSMVGDYMILAAKAEKGKLLECGTHQDDSKLPDFSSPLARAAEGKYHYTDRRNDDKRRSESKTFTEEEDALFSGSRRSVPPCVRC